MIDRPRFNLVSLAVFTLMPLTLCAARDGADMALRVSDTGRYFVDRNNKPFFWQGDTEWELFHVFSVPDARALLEKRRDQGFSVIQVMATGLYPELSVKWGAMKNMKAGEDIPAWLDNNPLAPNEAYFKRMDAIVVAAADFDLILVVGVYHAGDEDAGRITPNNAGPWARWLAQRYRRASNIVWGMYPHAVAASIPVIRATVQGLQEGDGGTHLLTMHPDPSPNSSSFMHTEPWLSFNTLQTWSTDFANYTMVAADYARTPVKPVVDGEARYEQESGTTPLQVRRAGYWACLAGGFYSYGHGNNWLSPRTWQKWCDTPGALQMKVLGGFFRSLEWWKLLPDPSIIVNPPPGGVAARSADGDWIVAYLTGSAAITLRLGGITVADSATAWWIDPLTGARSRIGTYPTSASPAFSPPAGWQDAILLVKKGSD